GATTGRNALADARVDGALINYHIIRVRVDPERCHPTYLWACFNSGRLQREVDREKGRGTREGVNTSTIARFRFALPDIRQQRWLADVFESRDSLMRSEEDNLRKLQRLRRGLVDDLMTGRTRAPVPEATH